MSKDKLLQDYIFVSKYARNKGNRKETWEEAVDRVMDMHRKHLKGIGIMDVVIDDILNDVTGPYKEQRILGAQRALQWGGDQLLKHQFRLYNCSATYADRAEFFDELMYVLLTGAGVGYSVQWHHAEMMPEIVGPTDATEVHIIGDSIEGWSEAVHALIMAYMAGAKKPIFDDSQVRPKGAPISGGFIAPGPAPLIKALELLEDILKKAISRHLTPLEIHEMATIIADAVISGGVRRAALICLFSADDEEMLSCKTGDWMHKKPWLARANNSAVILPDTPKEVYDNTFKYVKEYGEPGFAFLPDKHVVYNPSKKAA